MNKISTRKRSTLVLFLSLITGQFLYAQKDTTDLNAGGNNLIKVSITAPFVNNYNFQYERAIGRKISVGLGIHFMPKSELPFKSRLESLIDEEETWENVKNLKMSNFSITPEIRFYFGKGVFKGFYLAPFAKYSTYTAEMPFQFDVTDDVTNVTTKETIPLSGTVTSYTGGLLFGAQWRLSKLVYLDWWILGPNYGKASGNINGRKTLNSNEQDDLREQLRDLEDLPVVKTTSTVDANGARVDFDGPWAGLRAGLNIGFRF